MENDRDRRWKPALGLTCPIWETSIIIVQFPVEERESSVTSLLSWRMNGCFFRWHNGPARYPAEACACFGLVVTFFFCPPSLHLRHQILNFYSIFFSDYLPSPIWIPRTYVLRLIHLVQSHEQLVHFVESCIPFIPKKKLECSSPEREHHLHERIRLHTIGAKDAVNWRQRMS